MKRRSKKGFTLAEMIVVIPIAALVIVAGVLTYAVSYGGFKSGTSDFEENLQSTLLKELIEKTLPAAEVLSFKEPEEGCTAVIQSDGKLAFVENYQTEDERQYTLDDVKSLTFHVQKSGAKCKLKYTLVQESDGVERTYTGAVMLLNITDAAFAEANPGISLPADINISAGGTGTNLYLVVPKSPEDPSDPDDPENPSDPGNSDLSFLFTIKNVYYSDFKYNVQVINNSKETIYGWVMEFDYAGTLTSADQFTLENLGNHRYRLTSQPHTDVIAPGASVNSDGMGTMPSQTDPPKTISNVTIKKKTEESSMDVSMLMTVNPWNQGTQWAGLTYKIVITNHGTKDISGWILQFDYDGILTGANGGHAFLALGNNRYQITCPSSWNYVIKANGGSVYFDGSGTIQGTKVTNATINGISISVE